MDQDLVVFYLTMVIHLALVFRSIVVMSVFQVSATDQLHSLMPVRIEAYSSNAYLIKTERLQKDPKNKILGNFGNLNLVVKDKTGVPVFPVDASHLCPHDQSHLNLGSYQTIKASDSEENANGNRQSARDRSQHTARGAFDQNSARRFGNPSGSGGGSGNGDDDDDDNNNNNNRPCRVTIDYEDEVEEACWRAFRRAFRIAFRRVFRRSFWRVFRRSFWRAFRRAFISATCHYCGMIVFIISCMFLLPFYLYYFYKYSYYIFWIIMSLFDNGCPRC